MRKTLTICLLCQMVFGPTAGWCQPFAQVIPDLAGTVHLLPQISTNALPILYSNSSFSGLDEVLPFSNPDDKTLVVNQNQAKAVIDWKSFNIGAEAATHFNQKGHADWAVLNRIHDQNPSQLLGRMSADGHVYLINRNGILFGPDSQVNVGSLTASTLNLSNSEFLEGLGADGVMRFRDDAYLAPDGESLAPVIQAGVINRGEIVTREAGGKIFLFSKQISNEGNIAAFAGQVGLAAGTGVTLRQPEPGETQRIPLGYYVDVIGEPGSVTNDVNGAVLSDFGLTGMYGGEVIQNGIVRATTSPEKTSQIELLATDRVALGAQSWTATPVSLADDKFVGEKDPARIVIKGITTGDPGSDTLSTVRTVEVRGLLDAPSGQVTIKADERVYLESGSRIDVSGLWVDREAGEDVLDAQLNSLEMRDEFAQKNGILKGQRINFLASQGSAIGDVSGIAGSREQTAVEMNVAGGTIDIQVGVDNPVGETRDIIIREGAELNFAGGGIIYAEGPRETTRLLSGMNIFEISEAPQELTYDDVLGHEVIVHERFGVIDKFDGFYYGGAVPFLDYGGSYVEGADAGTLTLVAPRIVLDGTLNGSALIGDYQLFADPEDVPAGVTGALRPRGGTLQLGQVPPANASPELKDAVLESAKVVAENTPLTDFAAGDTLNPEQANLFSAGQLSGSGIKRLEIHANTELTVDAAAAIVLPAGGELELSARRIIQDGVISIPSGQVGVRLVDNLTSFPQLFGTANVRHVDLEERYFLGASGLIDVSGERVDNRLAALGEPVRESLSQGGSVGIFDQSLTSTGLILKSGSRIDVSGGYEVATSGDIRGGKAGSLDMTADTLILDGELAGKALTGQTGGALTLHAATVEVAAAFERPSEGIDADTAIPDEWQGLHLAAEQLAATGFTRIGLKSVNDLSVRDGVILEPSLARLEVPQDLTGRSDFSSGVRISSDGQPLPGDIGKTSISLAAGVILPNQILNTEPFPEETPSVLPNLAAKSTVETNAIVRVAPTGSLAVSGPEVALGGTLEAPAGKITVNASFSDLTIDAQATILATGWNEPESRSPLPGSPQYYTPHDGGRITLAAKNGSLATADGSLIDVSAAPMAAMLTVDAFDREQVVTTGGNPGRVAVEAFGELALAGTIAGRAAMENGQGGEFVRNNTNVEQAVALADADFEQVRAGGFDAVEFRSAGGFELVGAIDAGFGRALTIDARKISAEGAAEVSLTAPWLRLVNTVAPKDSASLADVAITAGEGQLHLGAEWLDLVGDVSLSGFSQVVLDAGRDLRVSDYDYSVSSESIDSRWSGSLNVPGDLTLEAARIFPEVPDDFTQEFAARNYPGSYVPAFPADFKISAGGKITTLPGESVVAGPVTSAGGRLVLEAGGGIEHRGNLLAPLGTLSLEAVGTGLGGRVLLAEGSRLSTAGTGSLHYGTVNNEEWFLDGKSSGVRQRQEITMAPEKSVAIDGHEIIQAAGSLIDVSGGGQVFGYQFEPGIDGTVNPLQGKMVIVPDPELKLPGRAIYLAGGDGISAGVYSILSESDAFREDALVLTDLGAPFVAGVSPVTAEGYPVIGGFETFQGTGIAQPLLNSYALRKASDVFREGKFVVIEASAGDGGNVSLQAPTTLVNGVLRATPLGDFSGGRVAMSGEEIFVRQAGSPLFASLDFESAIPDELRGTLNLDDTAVSGQGFSEIQLGDLAVTRTVTLEAGSMLKAEKVTLAGSEQILVETGARVDALATGGEGVVNLQSPVGRVVLEEGAVVHASDGLILATNDLSLQGDFQIDNSFLTLQGDKIVFLQEENLPAESALYITPKFWALFPEFSKVELDSASDIVFRGDYNLAVADTLTLDAKRVAGEGGAVALSAAVVTLANGNGSVSADQSLADTGSLTLTAGSINLGPGTVRADGFADVALVANGNVALQGQGGLLTGGNLAITADRVVVAGHRGANDVYRAGDFTIDTGSAALTIAGTGAAPVPVGDGGGRLTVRSGTISNSGVIDNSAGITVLQAQNGIQLQSGGEILARGTTHFAAGSVELRTQAGDIDLAGGSRIDVSAGGQGDAGRILLAAASGVVTVDGDLQGARGGADGLGGSLELDAATVGAFSGLNQKLITGGFDERIAVRARGGNLVFDDMVTAREIYAAADSGQLTVTGTLDAGGATKGGRIELHAGQDLILAAGSEVDASGTDQGGTVYLNSSAGTLRMTAGSSLDVSGAEGGAVHLRADRVTAGSGIRMDLQGTITGAEKVVAEGVQNYTYAGTTTLLPTTTSGMSRVGEPANANWQADAVDWKTDMSLAAPIGVADEQFHLRPGIEIEASNPLLTTESWDLGTASYRYGGEPGLLTVRSTGNLTVSGNLTDAPTPVDSLSMATAAESWGITLVAGAATGAADPAATQVGTGNLTVSADRQIYSEAGQISLSAGRNIEIGKGSGAAVVMGDNQYPIYVSVGAYAGDVSIRAGENLVVKDYGIVQTATGDIAIVVGKDITLGRGGAIRTLGEFAQSEWGVPLYLAAHAGGDLKLQAGGSLRGKIDSAAWDYNYTDYYLNFGEEVARPWGPSYGIDADEYTGQPVVTQGVATLGGGDLTIDVGGELYAQAGTFGAGNLKIFSGGNLAGRFLHREGDAEVRALGNIVEDYDKRYNDLVLEIFDTNLNVAAQGDLIVAAIVNPTIAREGFNPDVASSTWTPGYTEESRVSLTAVAGDVMLSGNSPYYSDDSVNEMREAILPATVEMTAGRDIRLLNTFAMLPAANGNLRLSAGGNIDGGYVNSSKQPLFSRIIMNDGDPSKVYGVDAAVPADLFVTDPEVGSSLLHQGDPLPIEISAVGNIENLGLRLPKMARITAGGDIRFIQYVGQNMNAGDATEIRAGHDIIVESGLVDTYGLGVAHGGPGTLLIQAGNRLDLGSSDGIRTYGSEKNIALGPKGSDLIVLVGYEQNLELPQLTDFFSRLKVYGEDYSTALAGGRTTDAQAIVAEAQENLILPTLGAAPSPEERLAGKGEIDMVESLIRTSGGVDNIYIIAGGDANIGRTVLGGGAESSDTGIATTAGGDVAIFVTGDLNVNESRVMTFGGGDILTWSDQGDINAGRGSRTAISRPPLKVVKDPVSGELSTVFSPPAVGSGLRALTYDPDGVAGPKAAPEIGDIYLIAPSGVIDAGEAGIAGGRVILGATEVLNAQNISFSFGSVGVAASSDSTASLGALAGVSNLNEVTSLIDQAGAFGEREQQTPTQVVDNFIEKWIDVEVIGFEI